MITAKDVYNATMKKPDPLIDDIITDVLIPVFKKSEVAEVSVGVFSITDYYGIDGEYFIKQMKLRGFSVEVKAEDRPCAEPYFIIAIPPQQE